MKLGMMQKLMLATGLLTAACNSNDNSGLTVAGGELDGSGGEAKYPGTVYVEMKSEDFDGNIRLIRNVGTIVDVGNPTKYGLVLSLADTMVNMNGMQVLPLFKAVQVNFYLSDKQNEGDKVALDAMQMVVDEREGRKGLFKTLKTADKPAETFPLIAVGLKTQEVPSAKSSKEKAELRKQVTNVEQYMFYEEPLETAGGNLRIQNTSYLMIGIPKAKIPANLTAKIRSVGVAGSVKGDKFVMAGFGETKYLAEPSAAKSLALNPNIDGVMKRNFAEVTRLKGTPLSKFGGYDKIASQLWEVTGSGLCGSSDGNNFDTGASIYEGERFVGFAVRSAPISAGYKGKLDCLIKSRSDMATLIVSPTQPAIDFFKKALAID